MDECCENCLEGKITRSLFMSNSAMKAWRSLAHKAWVNRFTSRKTHSLETATTAALLTIVG
jgi:hypothetical protein